MLGICVCVERTIGIEWVWVLILMNEFHHTKHQAPTNFVHALKEDEWGCETDGCDDSLKSKCGIRGTPARSVASVFEFLVENVRKKG